MFAPTLSAALTICLPTVSFGEVFPLSYNIPNIVGKRLGQFVNVEFLKVCSFHLLITSEREFESREQMPSTKHKDQSSVFMESLGPEVAPLQARPRPANF